MKKEKLKINNLKNRIRDSVITKVATHVLKLKPSISMADFWGFSSQLCGYWKQYTYYKRIGPAFKLIYSTHLSLHCQNDGPDNLIYDIKKKYK